MTICYLAIGHKNTSVQVWVLRGDDITYSKRDLGGSISHQKCKMGFGRAEGRVCHTTKRVSISPYSSDEDKEYARKILELDYPDYTIHLCK